MKSHLIKRLDKHSEIEGGKEYFIQQHMKFSAGTFGFAIFSEIILVIIDLKNVDLSLLILWATPLISLQLINTYIAKKILRTKSHEALCYFYIVEMTAFLCWIGYLFILGLGGATEIEILWRSFIIFIVLIFALNAMQYSLVSLFSNSSIVCGGITLYTIFFSDLPSDRVLYLLPVVLIGWLLTLKFGYGSYRLACENYLVISENKSLIATLDTMVSHDSLTEQHSRRYFDEQLIRHVALLPRNNSFFCLAIIDIDYFKSVNDSYGHQAGDNALIQLSKAIKGELRQTDIFARYGGEEFAIILSDTNLQDAVTVLEKVRTAIEHQDFHILDASLTLTISIGVTAAKSDSSPKSLINEADDALEMGRNQIQISG